LTAVGVGGALDEEPIFFRAHPAGEIVDVFHGIAPDAFAQHPCGVVDALRPRKLDDVAELLDLLIVERNHLANQTILNGVVADELAQPLQRRRQLGGGGFKVGLKIGQQSREIAALRAFRTAQLQLRERQLVFDFDGVKNPARVLTRPVYQIDRTGADDGQHHEPRREQQDLPDRAPALAVRRHNNLAS
jgi:hypothetical protein